MASSGKREMRSVLRFASAWYCSGLWAMVLALLVTQWTWLEMRFNVGWVFYGAWLVFLLASLSVKAFHPNWKLAAGSLVACVVLGVLICGSFRGFATVSACLIREGLGHSAWSLAMIDAGAVTFAVVGLAVIVVADVMSSDRRS